MSKTKIDKELPVAKPGEAAVRAAAEVLQVPCRVVAGKEPQFFRGRQKSDRDAEIKDYQYHVVQVEPHPDFAEHGSSALYASADKLRSGKYQPLSGAVDEILTRCVEREWLGQAMPKRLALRHTPFPAILAGWEKRDRREC